MDLNEKFIIEIRKMNEGFAKLQEDYNAALYNGVKYQDSDFIYTGINDFFQNLSNILNGYVKGYDNIMQTHLNMVKNLLSNDSNKKIKNNLKIITSRNIIDPVDTSGYTYSMNVITSVDLTILSELLDLDKMLYSISSYSSGELIQNYNFEFLPNFNRPTWTAKILGIDTPLSDKDFNRVSFAAFRNGDTQPKPIAMTNIIAKETLDEYNLNPRYLLNIDSMWKQIFGICKRLLEIIQVHRTRLDKLYKNSVKSLDNREIAERDGQMISDMDMMIIFMDKLKKASLVIDDILNIYSRLLKTACYALSSKITQEQYILVTVIDNDRSKN